MFQCDLAPGYTPPPNKSGDGNVIRIILETASRRNERSLTVSYLAAWDLENQGSGLQRACIKDWILSGDSSLQDYACYNEFEWGYFDLSSVIRIPSGRLSGKFVLEYVSAERSKNARVVLYPETQRLFECVRAR